MSKKELTKSQMKAIDFQKEYGKKCGFNIINRTMSHNGIMCLTKKNIETGRISYIHFDRWGRIL